MRVLVLLCLLGLGYLSPLGVLAQADLPPLPTTANATVSNLPVAQLAQIRVLVRWGRTQEALNKFETLLARQPDWVPALTERANLLSLLGRDDEARRDRERARRLNPDAADFYSSRSSFALLRFIALYPEDWFNDAYRSGELLTGMRPQAYNLEQFRDRQRLQVNSVASQDKALELIQLKLMGESQSIDRVLNQSVANQSRQWEDLMLGNLALLRQDLLTAVQYYNDADLSGARWPELYYNRGLASILLNDYVNGCADLSQSYRMGFAPGEVMLASLCTY